MGIAISSCDWKKTHNIRNDCELKYKIKVPFDEVN